MVVTATSGSSRGELRRNNRGESYFEVLGRLASAQKKAAPGSPPYSIYVNRPLGRFVAAAAYRVGLTPNAISAISFAFTISGILLLAIAPAQIWVGVVVWFALAFGYVLDSVDGQVARLRGGGSLAGEWLDHVLDSIKIPCLHLAVLLTMFKNFELSTTLWLLVPLAFAVVACVSFFSMILNDQLKIRYALQHGGESVAPASQRSVAKSILLVPTDYGVLCLLFLVLGFHSIFLAFYVAFFVANTAHLTLASRKWFADFRRVTLTPTRVSTTES